MNRAPQHVRGLPRPTGIRPWLVGLLVWTLGFVLVLAAWPEAPIRSPAPALHRPATAPAAVPPATEASDPSLPTWSGAVWILDDLGLDPVRRRRLLALPRWVVFSILPYGKDAPHLARAACDQGRTVLIHLPMEPLNPRQDPGPDAIRPGMGSDRIARIIARALRRVPCARGLNQHMGSRAARHLDTMRAVVRAAARHGLRLFVDSRTAGGSRLCAAAWELGHACYPRDVFLDATRDREQMVRRWVTSFRNKPVDLPLVVIMHPYRETLRLLDDMARAGGPDPLLTWQVSPRGRGPARVHAGYRSPQFAVRVR